MTIRITRLLVAALAGAAACTEPPYDGPLRGTWSLSMTLETPLPDHAAQPGTTVTGSVVIPDPTPTVPHAFPSATPADVRLDLRPFGVWIRPAAQPVVRNVGRDTVRLDLGSPLHELVLMGHTSGDSVTGYWTHEIRSAGMRGRFVMRRKR
jgi:hypothetical protein